MKQYLILRKQEEERTNQDKNEKTNVDTQDVLHFFETFKHIHLFNSETSFTSGIYTMCNISNF